MSAKAALTLNWLLGAGALLVPHAASACVFMPPPQRLPDEPAAAEGERHRAYSSFLDFDGRRAQQARLLELASTVSLARVTQVTRGRAGSEASQTSVVRLTAFKGQPAKGEVTLSSNNVACSLPHDGSASSAAVGEYVVLFEGDLNPISISGHYGIVLKEVADRRIWDMLRNAAAQLAGRQAP
jgi:hypothetical protein